jgi:hypothetical protein
LIGIPIRAVYIRSNVLDLQGRDLERLYIEALDPVAS